MIRTLPHYKAAASLVNLSLTIRVQPADGGLTERGYVSSSWNTSASRFRDDAWRCGRCRPPDGLGDYLGLLLTLSAAAAN
jgi:hypothetical protein